MYNQKMRWLVGSLLLIAIGCGTAEKNQVKKPETKEDPGSIVGVWNGKYPESIEGSDSKATNALAEKLGGFTMRLNSDGRFIADWRGLTKEGTWKLEGQILSFKTERVMGKDRVQAAQENAKSKSPVNTLELYDAIDTFEVDKNLTRLTMITKGTGNPPVVFQR